MTRSELLLKKLQAARAELDETSIIGRNRVHIDRASTLITDAIDVLIMREEPRYASIVAENVTA